jgi:hypothetical protein
MVHGRPSREVSRPKIESKCGAICVQINVIFKEKLRVIDPVVPNGISERDNTCCVRI